MEPAYSFSIPSLEDDTPLDCRIYHPKKLHSLLNSSKQALKGAIVAHPYPPLGGCYDDSVVLSVTETLLGRGYVVATFNFRGAGGSEGRTSWSGKPEQSDYSSIAGFLVYYLQQLIPAEGPYRLEKLPSAGNGLDSMSYLDTTTGSPIDLLLAGYSYGALILARLPPIPTILQRLHSAEIGTAGAELILRARTLAKQTRLSLEEIHSPTSPRGRQQLRPDNATTTTSPTKQRIAASPITMGGEETNPSARRRSRDSRRSMDFMRKSVEMPKRVKAHLKRDSTPGSSSPRKGSKDSESATPASPTLTTPATGTPFSAGAHGPPAVRVRYLVISPVLLPFTQTLLPPGPPNLVAGLRRSLGEANVGAQFLSHPTLAVFGSSDGFTAARRLRGWAEKTSKDTQGSVKFEWHEIEGAGHFWREAGVMQELQAKVSAWVKSTENS